VIIEIGPRLTFATPWYSNCLSMLSACGVTSIQRIERSHRMLVSYHGEPTPILIQAVANGAHDRMTQCVYEAPLTQFPGATASNSVNAVSVIGEGAPALERHNAEHGLGLDAQDIQYYMHVFRDNLRRDPTDAELFDIGKLPISLCYQPLSVAQLIS
jgi:phosphoribosylformylglycinamidine synthase